MIKPIESADILSSPKRLKHSIRAPPKSKKEHDKAEKERAQGNVAHMQSFVKMSHDLRWKLTKRTTLTGVAIVVLWMTMRLVAPVLSEILVPVVIAGLFMTILGIMPTDGMTIRALALLCVLGASLLGGLNVSAIVTQSESGSVTWDDEVVYECGDKLEQMPVKVCRYQIVIGLVYTATWLYVLFSSFRVLRPSSIWNIWDRKKPKGCRYSDDAFKLPARFALNLAWFGIRLIAFVNGTKFLLKPFFFFWWVNESDFPAGAWTPPLVSSISSGTACILLPCLFTPSFRRKILGRLNDMSAGEAQLRAACVAGLLRGRNPSKCIDIAKKRFRCIPFSKLKSGDFVKNREERDSENTLFKQTEETKLGDCHVFISHSWSDDGEAKYKALQEWCEQEKEASGEEVTVWLDKACIDQTNITESLVCLPIFLAGCRKLLIVAGHTYTERLWCIIEVFTFLTMGGDVSRIEVLAIDMNEKDAKTRFEGVDVRHCDCYEKRDKDKLLGLVETAFGDYEKFNHALRTVFNKQLSKKQTFISSSYLSTRTFRSSSKKQTFKSSSRRNDCDSKVYPGPPNNVAGESE